MTNYILVNDLEEKNLYKFKIKGGSLAEKIGSYCFLLYPATLFDYVNRSLDERVYKIQKYEIENNVFVLLKKHMTKSEFCTYEILINNKIVYDYDRELKHTFWFYKIEK